MKHFSLNERVCTYRNVNIGKLRNLNFKYPNKMRQKWQVFSAFLAQKNKCVGRRRWQGEKLCIISMCHFLPPLVVVMHYNAPHATHPPCMWGSMQIWHGSGRNGVTDVRVGSCATAACTTNATAALFTYRSQEGRRATGKIGIGFPPASSSLYKPACLLSKPLLGLLLACAALHNHVSCFPSFPGFLSTCSSTSSLVQSATGTSSPTLTTRPV